MKHKEKDKIGKENEKDREVNKEDRDDKEN